MDLKSPAHTAPACLAPPTQEHLRAVAHIVFRHGAWTSKALHTQLQRVSPLRLQEHLRAVAHIVFRHGAWTSKALHTQLQRVSPLRLQEHLRAVARIVFRHGAWTSKALHTQIQRVSPLRLQEHLRAVAHIVFRHGAWTSKALRTQLQRVSPLRLQEHLRAVARTVFRHCAQNREALHTQLELVAPLDKAARVHTHMLHMQCRSVQSDMARRECSMWIWRRACMRLVMHCTVVRVAGAGSPSTMPCFEGNDCPVLRAMTALVGSRRTWWEALSAGYLDYLGPIT